MEEIQLIINNIPSLLQYFVPGYITLFIFLHLTSIKTKDSYLHITILSCAMSYLSISLLALLREKFGFVTALPDTVLINSALTSILGILFSILCSLIYASRWFNFILVKLFHKSPHGDIWRNVLDFKNGSNLKIYIKDKPYYVIGCFRNIEEKGENSWLAITGFGKLDRETNELYKEEISHIGDHTAIFTIRISDVEYIEIY